LDVGRGAAGVRRLLHQYVTNFVFAVFENRQKFGAAAKAKDSLGHHPPDLTVCRAIRRSWHENIAACISLYDRGSGTYTLYKVIKFILYQRMTIV
jgi:hypothetical protein